VHQRRRLSDEGQCRRLREIPAWRGRQGRPPGRRPDQQGRLLLAVRPWADDRRVPGERLVRRRQARGPAGDRAVAHPRRHSGRWDAIGPEMFRLKDRNDRDMCLAMTHEEVIAWLAAREIRSYRDLPQIWYQIQTKERDEARPRSGVLRTREFVMKDSYTLDPDVAALDRSYAAHEQAYRKIFERCGLRFRVVQSDTGMMGGLGAHEFM